MGMGRWEHKIKLGLSISQTIRYRNCERRAQLNRTSDLLRLYSCPTTDGGICFVLLGSVFRIGRAFALAWNEIDSDIGIISIY